MYFDFLLNDVAPFTFMAMGFAWIFLMLKDIYYGLKHIIDIQRGLLDTRSDNPLTPERYDLATAKERREGTMRDYREMWR